MITRAAKGAYTRGRPPVDELTPSEQQVWDLYSAGKSSAEIAELVGLKRTSVTRMLVTIKEKVACR